MTGPAQAGQLDDDARTRLAHFADMLISGSPGWPSASDVDVHGRWMDRTLAARPDLVDIILSVLAIPGEPRDVLDGLRDRDRRTFDAFSQAIAGTYLMHPRVRRQLGLPAGPPEKQPAYPDEAEAYLEGGLLEPVIARGSIFRTAPDD